MLRGREVPLAYRIGVVAVHQQSFREEAVLERDDAIRAGIPARALGDAGHAVGMVISPGQDARPRR